MPILTIDYFAAKRLVEFYESLTACAGRAIEMRLSKPATALNTILDSEADAYIEAQAIVREYEQAETERITRRLQTHAATQMMLAPRARPEVLL